MNEWFTFLKRVPLKDARFLAAWPGMGSVALTVVNYLKDKLDAEFVGELNPEHYFAPTGASVSKQMIRPIDPPSNRFYYFRSSRRDTREISGQGLRGPQCAVHLCADFRGRGQSACKRAGQESQPRKGAGRVVYSNQRILLALSGRGAKLRPRGRPGLRRRNPQTTPGGYPRTYKRYPHQRPGLYNRSSRTPDRDHEDDRMNGEQIRQPTAIAKVP